MYLCAFPRMHEHLLYPGISICCISSWDWCTYVVCVCSIFLSLCCHTGLIVTLNSIVFFFTHLSFPHSLSSMYIILIIFASSLGSWHLITPCGWFVRFVDADWFCLMILSLLFVGLLNKNLPNRNQSLGYCAVLQHEYAVFPMTQTKLSFDPQIVFTASQESMRYWWGRLIQSHQNVHKELSCGHRTQLIVQSVESILVPLHFWLPYFHSVEELLAI